MELIEKAIEIATKAHDGQYRKTTDIPYITHPFSVGMMLSMYGYSEEVIVAGLLHDTLEDTDLTIQEIQGQFGKYIAELVQGASEKNKSLSWEERKQATINYLKNATRDLCLIICADKLHNIRSIRKSIELNGEKTWDRFNRGKDKQAWYYRSIVEQLEKNISDEVIFIELKKEVNRIFAGIPSS